MKGKEKCKILKEIRQKIADENGIEYITSECKHIGDCKGTCPKCESEVRYLERELEKKRMIGKRIAIVGIAAGMALTSLSCTDDKKPSELEGDVPYSENDTTEGLIPEPDDELLMGEPETPADLTGDVPYIDENGNEALNPGVELPTPGEVPDYFFPDDVKEYDDYSKEFIDKSMQGMSIDQVREAWGEEDMIQKSGDRGVIAYFTDVHDIIIQYDVETNMIINVTTMENYD